MEKDKNIFKEADEEHGRRDRSPAWPVQEPAKQFRFKL